MKKVLMLTVLAAVFSGMAFAETTPVFSGEFTMSTTVFGNKKEDNGTYKVGGKINSTVKFGAVVNKWVTVNAQFEIDEPDINDGLNLVVKLNNFRLKTDVMGAMGVAGPVGLVLTWGKVGYTTSEYGQFASWIDFNRSKSTGDYWGLGIDIVFIKKITLRTLVLPTTYLTAGNRVYRGDGANRIETVTVPVAVVTTAATATAPGVVSLSQTVENYRPVWYFELMMNDLLPGLKTSVAYVNDPQRENSRPDGVSSLLQLGVGVATKEVKIEPVNHIVFSAGYTTGPFSAALSLTYGLLDAEEVKGANTTTNAVYRYKQNGYYMTKAWYEENKGLGIGATVSYKIGTILTAGVAFNGQNVTEKLTDFGKMGVTAVVHIIPSVLDFYAAVSIPFKDFNDNLGIEGGIEAKLAGITYTLGYDYNNASYKSPVEQGMYFQISTKF